MNKENGYIKIVAQAFYGNRTIAEILRENLDRFILGYMEENAVCDDPIDRSVVPVPDTDGVVLIYNRYQEAERLALKEQLRKEKKYELKPLAVLDKPELKIYSRCIVCRMDRKGIPQSLETRDYVKFMHYLAE